MASAQKAWSPSAWLGNYTPEECKGPKPKVAEPAPKPEPVPVQSPKSKLRVVNEAPSEEPTPDSVLFKQLRDVPNIPVFINLAQELLHSNPIYILEIVNIASRLFEGPDINRGMEFVAELRRERELLIGRPDKAHTFNRRFSRFRRS